MGARWRGWLRNTRGIAAVEFALILPILLTLYLGTVESTQVLTADRRVILLASTLSDITSQASRLTEQDLAGLVSASVSVLAPLDSTKARVRLTSIAIAATGPAATVCWSYAKNWTTRARGTALDTSIVPAGLLLQTGSSLILAEVEYPYTPAVAEILTGTVTLASRQLMRPRSILYVEKTDVAGSGKPSPLSGPCV